MNFRFITTLLGIALLVQACEKPELPIAPRGPGEEKITQVEMGADYAKQLYYDLASDALVLETPKVAWDINFESAPEGWHIYLNSALGGALANTGETDFSAVTTHTGWNFTWDVPEGTPERTAMGDWRANNSVFVIDLGYTPGGTHRGYRKLKIEAYNEYTYTFSYAEIDGSDLQQSVVVNKDVDRNFTSFSLLTHQVIEATPPKEAWDLKFSQYTTIFDNTTPYLVTGVLLNPNHITVALDTTNAFESINSENAATQDFSGHWNSIGFDWKWYNYDAAAFEILQGRTYIIKKGDDVYYKLQFLDFYTNAGDKGAPRFRFQLL